MPNNFKLQGDYYVSKAGNDANDGLTPDTPKLTVQAALNLATSGNRTIIVSSGVYSEVITKTWSVAAQLSILGDGTVVLDGTNYTATFNISGVTNSGTLYIRNISFVRYFNVSVNYANNALPIIIFEKCFIDSTLLSLNASSNSGTLQLVVLRFCILLNTTLSTLNSSAFQTTVNGYFQIFNSILINCGTNSLRYGPTPYSLSVQIPPAPYSIIAFLNSYTDSSTALWINPAATNFNFNNIQGKIAMPINGAVSGVNSNGVALSFAQHRIDYPTYNVNSFSSDPKFNNPRLLDFTLQAGSPNVSASSDYVSNIGGTEYAAPFTASSAAFTTNATSQSLEYRGNLYYAISGSATTGSITSGPMFLQWPRTKPMTSINWIGALEFNKTITASLAGNNNVPAYTTFTSASGLAGANPDRLKIRMRFSTQQTQPATDAEWDNNGYWPAGTYQLFEPNTKPKIDYKGTGNGDPTYVETSAIGDLVPSWVQTQIVLRNDYNR